MLTGANDAMLKSNDLSEPAKGLETGAASEAMSKSADSSDPDYDLISSSDSDSDSPDLETKGP